MSKLVAVFLIITTQYLSVQGSEYYFNRLDTRSGLSNNAVTAIYQDDLGAIWLGLYGGLNRYNGQSIENFPLSQDSTGLTQNVIHKIIGNKKRQIFIRALRDVLVFDLETEQFETIYRDQAEDIILDDTRLFILCKEKVEVFDQRSLQKERSFDLPPNLSNPTRIWINEKGCWIGTEGELLLFPTGQKEKPQTILEHINVRCLYEDRKGNLWVGSNSRGVLRIAPNGSITSFQHQRYAPSLVHNEVRSIVEDNYGNLYFGTFLGMSRYNPIRNEWNNYISIDGVNHSLSHSSIYSLYRDNQGSIWIGTWFGGVNHFNPSADIFKFYGVKNDNAKFLSFPFVSKIAEDKNGNLWIGTEGGGLNYLNRKTNRFTHFVHREGDPQTIAGNNIKSIHYDPNSNRLYIGTHASGLSILDAKTLQFKHFRHNPADPQSIPSNIINHIYPYNEQLILLTQKGIVLFDPQTYRCVPFPLKKEITDILAQPFVFETLLIDSANQLWIAKTTGGLLRIDLTSGSLVEYYNNPTDSTSIGKYRVVSMVETKQKKLFFGTVGSGLFEFRAQTNNFKAYTHASGDLSGDICYAIGESSYEHLFVLHDRGVSLLKRDNNNLTGNYSLRFPNANFFLGSSIFFTQDDETFIGSSEGLFRFYEPQLYTTYNDYNLYFDKLTVNNSPVYPTDKTKILDQALALSPQIDLDHNQNNFSISFATSNYIANTNYLFEYKLEGFDKQWIAAPANGVIVYTNINPGRYRLIVRSTQSSDPTPHEIELNICINPPFYASIWGYMLYILVIGYALYRWVRFNRSQAMLKASLEMERREKEQIEALNQMKLRFFTNVSHEFRTPLSLIIAQIEILLSSDNLTASIYNRALKINNHANNLKRLITELLDFRKIDQGFIKLHVSEGDLTAFLNEIGTAFYEYAQSRSISFNIQFDRPSIVVWFDPLQLSKVFNNLLSNAFKYTPIGGEITLTVEEQEQQVLITVTDSGQGISAEAMKRIFERFYQVDDLPVSGLSSSTGIGLALSKNIIDLHHGSIHVESSEGKGSSFVVALSKDPACFTDEERTPTQGHKAEPIVPYLDEIPEWIVANETTEPDDLIPTHHLNKPTILIVEDNPELLQTLEELFAKDYDVHTAQNGEEGLQKTRQLFPDLILSDVVMPHMSGKEMCHQIKQDIELSHIPLILLTANSSLEQAIEGYEFGADDYITKPFNIKMLIVRCSNLIRSRRQLMQQLAMPSADPSQKRSETTEDPDQRFIEQVSILIKQNLNNHNFDIDFLAHQLSMGRTKLYARIKNITGITPNEMVLQLKLEESAKLLIEEPGLTISEISYQVGFTSPKYFTKCFKSVYTIAPLEYRKQMANEERVVHT